MLTSSRIHLVVFLEMVVDKVTRTNLVQMPFHTTLEGKEAILVAIPNNLITQLSAGFSRLVPQMGHGVFLIVAPAAIPFAVI